MFHQSEHNVHKADLILDTFHIGVLNGNNLLNLIEKHVISLAFIYS